MELCHEEDIKFAPQAIFLIVSKEMGSKFRLKIIISTIEI